MARFRACCTRRPPATYPWSRPCQAAPTRAGPRSATSSTRWSQSRCAHDRPSCGACRRGAGCPQCGALPGGLISLPRRVDNLIKIKGMLVNPQALVDAVLDEPALIDFQAVVDKENPSDPLSMDRLRLRIVPAAGA